MKKILASVLICTAALTIGSGGSPTDNIASAYEDARDNALIGLWSSNSRYGPFSTSGGNVPKKAYSPFDEHKRREAEQERAKRAKYRSDSVLIKLRPQQSGGGVMVMASEPTSSILPQIAGLESMERVFPRAKAPLPESSGVRVMSVENEGREPKKPDLTRWYRARIGEDRTVEQVVAGLKANSLVDVVEPDYEYKLAGTIPDSTTDPNYAQQWHLDTIHAPQAWQYLEDQGLPGGGSSDVIVAVIDSGVDYTHPDLAPNMWVNSREIPNNGVDDDGNGFVDDIHGVSVEGSE